MSVVWRASGLPRTRSAGAVAAVLAIQFGSAFRGGTVVSWRGMARYGLHGILVQDLNSIVCTVIVVGCFFIVINLIVDFIVAFIDPRVRLGARAQ